MQLRRLTSADKEVYRKVLEWDASNPRWWREAEAVYGEDTLDVFLDNADDPTNYIDVLVGNNEAVVSFHRVQGKEWEIFLSAPRKSNAKLITEAGARLCDEILAMGVADTICAWINKKNRGVRECLQEVGFILTGVTALKSDGKKIYTWQHLNYSS